MPILVIETKRPQKPTFHTPGGGHREIPSKLAGNYLALNVLNVCCCSDLCLRDILASGRPWSLVIGSNLGYLGQNKAIVSVFNGPVSSFNVKLALIFLARVVVLVTNFILHL